MPTSTLVERTSDVELVTTRTFEGRATALFEAWTRPELIVRWWAPKSFGISFLSCETDARTGGSYRFVFGHPASGQPMAFFGRYLDVETPSRLVWTNEEDGEGPVTTVTLTENLGQTAVVVRDRYPSKEALDAAAGSGGTGAWPEQFEALAELLGGLRTDA